MTTRSSRRVALSALAVLATLIGGLALYLRPAPPPDPQPQADGPRRIALYCQFYVFVESRPFVAFLMEQTPDEPGRYRQLYVAKADGDRTDYNALAGVTPEWRLDAAANPPRLHARVTVPDPGPVGLAEQDIAIEAPGFDARAVSDVFGEASLKSVYYQNLPGKCRQSVLRPAGQ